MLFYWKFQILLFLITYILSAFVHYMGEKKKKKNYNFLGATLLFNVMKILSIYIMGLCACF